jgi:cellulose synthase/poly-beta-1,6-N-acetylglucosamine synthase-like glycosyltransferase
VSELPRVDVVVSTLDEEAYVERCLQNVLGQDYPPRLVRAVLVDGGSTDRTVEIARRIARLDGRLELVADGRRRSLPEAMNEGVAHGSAELVAKIDAHGYPARDFLRRAVEAFASSAGNVACVGGRPEQTGETEWGEAAALARMSRFGVGGSVYAGKTARGFVDTVQCGVYRRAALEEVGGFDPSMAFGEDDELNWRLRGAGYRILLDTSIRFTYVTRPSLRALFRQYRNYGRAKVRVIARHPRFVRPWHLAPAALVAGAPAIAVAAGLGSRSVRVAAAIGAVGYVTAGTAAAVRAAPSRGPVAVGRVSACFGAIHTGYGLGMIEGVVGLVARKLSRRNG